jgi:protoporphyrinogen oxidase
LLKDSWVKVDRLTRFYIRNKFFVYPIELKNAILNLGPVYGSKIAIDYILERVKAKFDKKEIVSFQDKVISDFGLSLAKLNMLNYTEKVWGLPCSQISPDWASQRIKGLSISAILKNALFKSKDGPKTLVDQFYYPKMGTGTIYEAIKSRIELEGIGKILLNSFPIQITHDGSKVNQITIQSAESLCHCLPDHVISSIPVTDLVKLFIPAAPQEVLDAADKLKYRSHISLFVTLKKSSVFPDQWVYFPDEDKPFGRIMEPRNFSKSLSPKDCTSLLIEFFCWENDELWNSSKEELLEKACNSLEKMEFLKKEDVLRVFIHREKYAYPVYDLGYKENRDALVNYLKRFHNLQLIGRAGSFRYNNQDHALEMGILAAKNLIEGNKYSIEDVGSEKDYFEKYSIR